MQCSIHILGFTSDWGLRQISRNVDYNILLHYYIADSDERFCLIAIVMIESFCDFVILYVKDFAIIFLSLSRTVSNYHNKCKYCYDLQTTIMNQNKLPLTISISITIKLSLSQSHKYQQYHRIAICHACSDVPEPGFSTLN